MSLLQPSEELGDEVFGLLLHIILREPLRHNMRDLEIRRFFCLVIISHSHDVGRSPVSNGSPPPASLAAPDTKYRSNMIEFLKIDFTSDY